MPLDIPAYRAAVLACTRCSEPILHRVPRFGTGPTNPRLMIVGQNPPSDPVRSMHGAWMLHYGPEGKGVSELLVLDLIESLGYRPAEVWATQGVKCPTVGNEMPPRVTCQLRCSTSFLRHEIRELNPPIILAFGSGGHDAVLQAVHGVTGPYHVRYVASTGGREGEVKSWTLKEDWDVIDDRVRSWHLGPTLVIHAPHPATVGRFLVRSSWVDNIKLAMGD